MTSIKHSEFEKKTAMEILGLMLFSGDRLKLVLRQVVDATSREHLHPDAALDALRFETSLANRHYSYQVRIQTSVGKGNRLTFNFHNATRKQALHTVCITYSGQSEGEPLVSSIYIALETAFSKIING